MTAEQGTGNVMIGMLQPAPTVAPVVVGRPPPAAVARRRRTGGADAQRYQLTSITASSRR
ncbi:hypothetical protein M8494_29380 [Serratia ureilytica]